MEPSHVVASILATQAQAEFVRSALPDAPVVPDRPRKPRRIRSRTAAALYRIADAVAPADASERPTLAAGEGSALIRWDESHCRPSRTASA
jgi:hypothetical protein